MMGLTLNSVFHPYFVTLTIFVLWGRQIIFYLGRFFDRLPPPWCFLVIKMEITKILLICWSFVWSVVIYSHYNIYAAGLQSNMASYYFREFPGVAALTTVFLGVWVIGCLILLNAHRLKSIKTLFKQKKVADLSETKRSKDHEKLMENYFPEIIKKN